MEHNEIRESDRIIQTWRGLKTESVEQYEPDFRVIDQIAENFSPGTFFYYIFDFASYQTRYVHPNVRAMTSLDPGAFNPESYLGRVHADDVAGILKKEEYAMKFLGGLDASEITNYKISYTVRIKKPDNTFYYNLHQATTLNLTESGSISNVLCIETDITHLGGAPLDTISFIDLRGNESFYNLDINNFNMELPVKSKAVLSRKEMEVLRKISFGQDNKTIAEEMHISVNTVRTHRKNILRKENVNNMVELVAEYVRNGLI